MESELLQYFILHEKEHYTIARYLEPHLSLIKSHVLNQLYNDLRYHRGTYPIYLSTLVEDSITDYRLRSVLEKILKLL
jgi:hypothetical protein